MMKLYTTSQIAEELGVCKNTIFYWEKTGKIPKPKREPVKVESKKAPKASSDAKASRKATVRSSGKISTKNKKVAPKVRTGSSKGRSPSKRRRVSK